MQAWGPCVQNNGCNALGPLGYQWNACQEGMPVSLHGHVIAPCLQVLYTMPNSSSKDDSIISESGAMNVFFLLDKVVV